MVEPIDEESGAINTLSMLIGLGLLVIALAIGAQALRSEILLARASHELSDEASQLDGLVFRMSRDADSAAALYFPQSCGGATVCDEIRFAKIEPNQEWHFWGYAAVPAQQAVAYCDYGRGASAAEAPRCNSPVLVSGVQAFRVDAIAPAALVSRFAALGAYQPETHSYPVFPGDTASVLAGNTVFVVRAAAPAQSREVHLLPGIFAGRIDLLLGTAGSRLNVYPSNLYFSLDPGFAAWSTQVTTATSLDDAYANSGDWGASYAFQLANNPNAAWLANPYWPYATNYTSTDPSGHPICGGVIQILGSLHAVNSPNSGVFSIQPGVAGACASWIVTSKPDSTGAT